MLFAHYPLNSDQYQEIVRCNYWAEVVPDPDRLFFISERIPINGGFSRYYYKPTSLMLSIESYDECHRLSVIPYTPKESSVRSIP